MINWIAVEDRLPPTQQDLLMWDDKGGVCVGYWRTAEQTFWPLTDLGGSITHWAELSDINPPGAKQ